MQLHMPVLGPFAQELVAQQEVAQERAKGLAECNQRLEAHVHDLESRKRAPLYQKKQEEELRAANEKAAEDEARAQEAEAKCRDAKVRSAGSQCNSSIALRWACRLWLMGVCCSVQTLARPSVWRVGKVLAACISAVHPVVICAPGFTGLAAGI